MQKMKVLAFSIITDLGVLGKIVENTRRGTKAANSSAKMAQIMREVIQKSVIN